MMNEEDARIDFVLVMLEEGLTDEQCRQEWAVSKITISFDDYMEILGEAINDDGCINK